VEEDELKTLKQNNPEQQNISDLGQYLNEPIDTRKVFLNNQDEVMKHDFADNSGQND